jgi:hypothetical protein
LRDGGLDEWGEKTTTFKLILDTKPFINAKSTPLRVDLAVKVEVAPLEGEVPRNYEKAKTYPEEEGVHRKERTIVEENAGPTDDRSDDTETGGDGGEDEFCVVANPDDIGMLPDIKPRAEKKYGACEGVTRELWGEGGGTDHKKKRKSVNDDNDETIWH